MESFYCPNLRKGMIALDDYGLLRAVVVTTGHAVHALIFTRKWYIRILKMLQWHRLETINILQNAQERREAGAFLAADRRLLVLTQGTGNGCAWSQEMDCPLKGEEAQQKTTVIYLGRQQKDVHFSRSDQISPSFGGAKQEVRSWVLAVCPRWSHCVLLLRRNF